MARRRRRRQHTEEKSGFAYTSEVIGLIMILLSAVGLATSGIVGGWIKNFSVFMFGSWYFLFLIFTLGLGVFMIIKRGKPNYFTARLIGIYCLIIAILVLSHTKMVVDNGINVKELLHVSMNYIKSAFKDATLVKTTGGGMVGALFTWAAMSLFNS